MKNNVLHSTEKQKLKLLWRNCIDWTFMEELHWFSFNVVVEDLCFEKLTSHMLYSIYSRNYITNTEQNKMDCIFCGNNFVIW